MTTLAKLARLIRSKNAGPFCLTLDVLFDKPADYQRVLAARVITPEKMAALYQQPLANVQVFNHERALAMKVSLEGVKTAAKKKKCTTNKACKSVCITTL